MRSAESVLSLTRELCAFRTGVVARENEALFARLAREVPLTLHRYASGSEHNGWLVPDLWSVEHARVARDGEIVLDADEHALVVAAYSRPFHGSLELEELRPRLVTSAAVPEAYVYHCMWQYRPWDAEWALSIPYERYARLEPGRYEVDLATRYEQGEMLVGEAFLQGRSERTIVLQAHTCHPHMANDGMAGVATVVRLFQRLAEREPYYSYRLLLGPEHLGTVFYLADRSREELERLVCGIFAEMPGTHGPITVASTFLGGQPLDAALRNAVRAAGAEHRLVSWRQGAGNDETVWEAPGYEVPFAEVTRSEHLLEPFREYHTSLDTPDLMDEARLDEFLDVLDRAVTALEGNARPLRRFDGLVALSNPHYGLYRERPDPAVAKELPEDAEKWGVLLDSLLRYLDGSMTVLDIAERHDLPFAEVLAYLRRFEEKELVRLEHAPVERAPISERPC